MVKWLYSAALFALAACAQQAPRDTVQVPAGPPTLEVVWRLNGLSNPESAAPSADGTFLYVSNISGEGGVEDGDGFISRISLDGRMLEREWVRGLDAPKGLVLVGGVLYTTDINDVVAIGTATGAMQRFPVEGARFLNDAAVTAAGLVLVTDSATQRVHAVRDGAVDVWLEHELLAGVNGLWPEEGRLVVTTMAGRLLAVDYGTRAIEVLAEGIGQADGVAPIGAGRYIVSHWPGQVHVVASDGSHTTVLDTTAEGRYMNDFVQIGNMIYMTHFQPGEMTAYRVVQRAP